LLSAPPRMFSSVGLYVFVSNSVVPTLVGTGLGFKTSPALRWAVIFHASSSGNEEVFASAAVA
ncbi:hypothetical protein, partial [uncultured Corynebacterium sp.]|uniref:hypothetical protein n=1 Tax=uncultured Corynebacterium sp. TaxID=159447 RepID=UPI00288C24BE